MLDLSKIDHLHAGIKRFSNNNNNNNTNKTVNIITHGNQLKGPEQMLEKWYCFNKYKRVTIFSRI